LADAVTAQEDDPTGKVLLVLGEVDFEAVEALDAVDGESLQVHEPLSPLCRDPSPGSTFRRPRYAEHSCFASGWRSSRDVTLVHRCIRRSGPHPEIGPDRRTMVFA